MVNYGISNTIERYHSLSLRQQYALQTWIPICFHNAYSPICCLDMIKTNADSLSLIPLEITFDRTSVTSWINTNNYLKIIVCKVVTTLVRGETKFTPCLLVISDHRHHWFRQRLVISSWFSADSCPKCDLRCHLTSAAIFVQVVLMSWSFQFQSHISHWDKKKWPPFCRWHFQIKI